MQTDKVKLLQRGAWSFFNKLSFLKPGLVNVHHAHARPLGYCLPALSYRQTDLALLSNVDRANSDESAVLGSFCIRTLCSPLL